jgi:hypothetical protein
LWLNGLVSLTSLAGPERHNSNSLGIIKLVDKSTGKKSRKSTDFNQTNWASVTVEYLSSISTNFCDARKFDRIMKKVATFTKGRCRDLKTGFLDDSGPQVGGHALLVEDTDSNSE